MHVYIYVCMYVCIYIYTYIYIYIYIYIYMPADIDPMSLRYLQHLALDIAYHAHILYMHTPHKHVSCKRNHVYVVSIHMRCTTVCMLSVCLSRGRTQNHTTRHPNVREHLTKRKYCDLQNKWELSTLFNG